MTRKVSSGTLWEPVAGDGWVGAEVDCFFVACCILFVVGDGVRGVAAAAQTTQAIANVAEALERLGAGLADVVRTRMFVTDISRWEEYGRAHGAAFGDIRPATSMVEVAALIDPRMLVEVEADAYKPGIGA